MNRLVCLAFFALLALSASAQSGGYRVEATLAGVRDSTCFLAHYLDKQHSIRDTAKADASGRVVFEGDKPLPEGLYVISVGRWRYFDVILDGDQHFRLQTDTTNFIASMKVEGSRENELFYAYNQKMQQRFDDYRKLQQLGESPVRLKAIQQEMSDYRSAFIRDNAGTFAAKLLRAATEPELPPAPRRADGRADSTYLYHYYKAHYFDNFDLTDERMVRTPLLAPRVERYFADLVVQSPDSLIREADALLAKVPKKEKDLRKYLIYKITSPYEQSHVLGTEGLFVHMGEKYYIGEPGLYDTSTVRRFRERIATLKPTLVGKKIPNMVLTDTLGRAVPLHNVKADYTVVFIYDPECGHCREATPKVLEFLKKKKAQGVAVYAANLKRDPAQWKKFIREFKTQEFVNGIDLQGQTDFWHTFDAQSTPVIFVLDRDKKILARRLPAAELEKYWEFMQSQRGTQRTPPAPKPTPAPARKVAGR